MKLCFRTVVSLGLALGATAAARSGEEPSLRARWEMPPRCTPFAPVRVKDLKEELRQTGYRLVIAIHPERPAGSQGEYPPRDLYLVNADGTGLRQLTDTPDREEHVPRTSPDGKTFSYNYGDYLVDVATLKTKTHYGGYVWTPDSRQTARCEKGAIVYTDVETNRRSKPVRYTIDFMPAAGGPIRKLPNHPAGGGECHPAFSPDGKWMCWNAGGSLGVRRFDPDLPQGTDGQIVTLPKEKLGQDPCGRWSHCGRYIAYVKIPHAGSWRVHSPICIVRLADNEAITISPPGWQGHHWDYDWLPPASEQ